jgi:hypothetical protein
MRCGVSFKFGGAVRWQRAYRSPRGAAGCYFAGEGEWVSERLYVCMFVLLAKRTTDDEQTAAPDRTTRREIPPPLDRSQTRASTSLTPYHARYPAHFHVHSPLLRPPASQLPHVGNLHGAWADGALKPHTRYVHTHTHHCSSPETPLIGCTG